MNTIYEFIAREFGEKETVNIVEIGGHIGTDTVSLSKFVGNGNMIVFEPDPRNIPIIRSRINESKVKLVPMAIGAINGQAQFHLSSGIPPYEDSHILETTQHTASSSLKAPKNHLERFPWVKFENIAIVDVISLDSYFNNLSSPIDFMWADVQGAELELILGGKKTLENTKFLYTEFNNNEMYEGQENLNKLMSELPGKWSIVKKFGDEILLQNNAFGNDWSYDSHAQQCWDLRYASSFEIMQKQAKLLAKDFEFNVTKNYEFMNILTQCKYIFEAGCGTGELADSLCNLPSIQKVTAVDCSKVAIELAKASYSRCEFKIHDARFPYDGQFDLAITSNVLQLFKNPFLLIDNMLKLSNYCIIMVPYKQPLCDGYDDEGGYGHVFSFDEETFNKYNVISKIIYSSSGWQHSSKGEQPLIMAVLIKK